MEGIGNRLDSIRSRTSAPAPQRIYRGRHLHSGSDAEHLKGSCMVRVERSREIDRTMRTTGHVFRRSACDWWVSHERAGLVDPTSHRAKQGEATPAQPVVGQFVHRSSVFQKMLMGRSIHTRLFNGSTPHLVDRLHYGLKPRRPFVQTRRLALTAGAPAPFDGTAKATIRDPTRFAKQLRSNVSMSAKSQVSSGNGEERLGRLPDRSTARSIDRSIVLLVFSIERRLPVLVSVLLAAQVLNFASGSGSGARASPSVHTHKTKAQAKVVIKARRSLVPGKTLTIVRSTGWVEGPTGFVVFVSS